MAAAKIAGSPRLPQRYRTLAHRLLCIVIMLSFGLPILLKLVLDSPKVPAVWLILGFAGAGVTLVRRGKDTRPVEAALGIYLLLFSALPLLLPIDTLRAHYIAGIYLSLLLMTALYPRLKGEAFTLTYARLRVTDPEALGSEAFRRIVNEMAWIWAILFALSAVIAETPYRQMTLFVLGVGLPFTILYPKWRKRNDIR